MRFLATNSNNDTDSYFFDIRGSDGTIRIIEFTGTTAASIAGTATGGQVNTTVPL